MKTVSTGLSAMAGTAVVIVDGTHDKRCTPGQFGIVAAIKEGKKNER
ncbi:hypothetical protein [Budvicia aquatica]|nr:hypothetical protein [Budvicia aquatica]